MGSIRPGWLRPEKDDRPLQGQTLRHRSNTFRSRGDGCTVPIKARGCGVLIQGGEGVKSGSKRQGVLRAAAGPAPPRAAAEEGGGPLLRKERWPAIGSAVPRSTGREQRPPVGIDDEKSLCPSPQRIPLSLRADNTLAAVPPPSGRGGRRGRGGRWAPTAPDTPDPSL